MLGISWELSIFSPVCLGFCLRGLAGSQGLPCDIQGGVTTGLGGYMLAGMGSLLP